MLIVNGAYRRPPDSEPDHSGEVMTGTGATWVSAKVICLPSCSAERSASVGAGALLDVREAVGGEVAVGRARQVQDRVGDVDVGLQLGLAGAGAVVGHPVAAAQDVDLAVDRRRARPW